MWFEQGVHKILRDLGGGRNLTLLEVAPDEPMYLDSLFEALQGHPTLEWLDVSDQELDFPYGLDELEDYKSVGNLGAVDALRLLLCNATKACKRLHTLLMQRTMRYCSTMIDVLGILEAPISPLRSEAPPALLCGPFSGLTALDQGVDLMFNVEFLEPAEHVDTWTEEMGAVAAALDQLLKRNTRLVELVTTQLHRCW